MDEKIPIYPKKLKAIFEEHWIILSKDIHIRIAISEAIKHREISMRMAELLRFIYGIEFDKYFANTVSK